MYTLTQLQLLKIWKKNPFAIYSISQIMQLTQKKTKPWVFITLKDFVKKKILNTQRTSHIDLYSLNLANPLSFQLLHSLEVQDNLNFHKLDIISQIVQISPVKNFTLLVFGSYAQNKQTPKSDLDLCFIIDNKETEKKMKPYIEDVKLNTSITLDEHYITCDEFTEMLKRDEENIGKQIFRKHKIFYNPDTYYQILQIAYKHGFRP